MYKFETVTDITGKWFLAIFYSEYSKGFNVLSGDVLSILHANQTTNLQISR